MALHIVQYSPEIPQNTGNIMRTCAASGVNLHFIKPIGFSLDEKSIKRSGANYGSEVVYSVYENWDEFKEKNKSGNFYFCTTYGQKNYSEIDFTNSDEDHFIIVGGESVGISKDILVENYERCFRVPMTDKTTTLNVSNIAAIMIYEAMRQQEFSGLCKKIPQDKINEIFSK